MHVLSTPILIQGKTTQQAKEAKLGTE